MPDRPPPSPTRRPPLARSWSAWVLAALVVGLGQLVMWRGWRSSGQWEPARGGEAILGVTVYGTTAAVPVVMAVLVLRHRISLGLVLVGELAVAVATGSFFATSTSSTAAFAWFGPLVYGLVLVAVVITGDGIASSFAARWRD